MGKTRVEHIAVAPGEAGRRIDNYLTGLLQDVPKTRVYRMLRKGEVRVNGGRIRPDYRLKEQDIIRIPPLYRAGGGMQKVAAPAPSTRLQEIMRENILYEDDWMVAVNKPAGIAVHAGSGEPHGVIEIMRALRPDCPLLELVHRLDKLTSGCLLLAKDHRYLRELHDMLRQNRVRKHYIALLYGNIPRRLEISRPLRKNTLRSGERMVRIDAAGKPAKTFFYPVRKIDGATLVEAEIATGRTHQIRVHAAHCGHPVAGDPKYGDRDFNRAVRRAGLRRMFLHADSLTLTPPRIGKTLTIHAPLPGELEDFLDKYRRKDAKPPD